jgi:rubrerythrin
VYQVFAELWKAPIFTNIAAAEQRHMDAVGLLITKYGLDDPVIDDTIGVFSSESGLAELYTTLTGSGTKSLLDALEAGVQIEEKDIADLKTALSQTDKSDIQWVFGNLLRGSSNHLRAFTRCIEAGGTGCSLQGTSGRTGNGKGADNGVCPCCGRGGRGNGNGCRFGNGSGMGNGNQNGMCQQSQQRKRDGSCLQVTPAAPARP